MNNTMFFNLSVSSTNYVGKCQEWGKLRYRTMSMDIKSLVDYIKKGYCFTHTFKDVDADDSFGCKQKTVRNFKSTNTVFLDVDGCSLTAQEFYNTITPKPSIVYTTPSNITGTENRFRLVYIYEDAILSNEDYKNEVKKIYTSIGCYIPDFKFDTTSINVSQQMGGNGLDNCQLYQSNNIFNFSSFQEYDCIPISYKKEERNDISNRNAVDYEEVKVKIDDKEFIVDFWNINEEIEEYDFMKKYKDKYPISETTQVNEDVPYIDLDDNYIEIARRYYVVKDENGNNKSIPVKIKKGNRERILFDNALLRLKMNPKMNFENLLYAMVFERRHWIDNSDGEFTNKTLYKIAKGAFTQREKYNNISTSTAGQRKRREKTNKNGFKVNKAFCEKRNVQVRSVANIMRGDIANEILLENFDFGKSVKENSRLLKEQGIKPNSERRLYKFKRWCKDNGFIQDC